VHRLETAEAALRPTLGILETAGISVAMMAPTAAMALNGALAASAGGTAVPLAFVLGFITILLVAFAFVTFARIYATPASVGEFNARGIGPLAGRLSGWTLLLVYVLFVGGSAAEFGAFAASAFAYAGVTIGWAPLALACLITVAYVGIRPARTSSRAMLVIEGISIGAVIVLACIIFGKGGAGGISLAPFSIRHTPPLGLGVATVFALLSFAGFEGAAVLGAESIDPKRTIPRALIASVVSAGLLYVFIMFAQSIGFGLDARGVAAFAASGSPLGDLAVRYAGVPFAAFVMGGAAISAFAATLASATAAARLTFSFARDGHFPQSLGTVDARSGTPVRAFLTTVVIGTVIAIVFALCHVSGTDTFGACGTIATLGLIIIYATVQIAALRLFFTQWNIVARCIPIIAFVLLVFTFVATMFPIPSGWPALYPYTVAAWILAGVIVLRKPSRIIHEDHS
jgi:amino acid transporter